MIVEKDFAGRQICGGRDRQEDAYAFSNILGTDGHTAGLLVVVADGMGGHKSGERASKVAMEAFVNRFQHESGAFRTRLQNSMTASNAGLASEFKQEPELEGMGTTLVAAAVTQAGIHWISVGDSLLYLLRKGKLKRLNADHSFRPFLDAMTESGEITPQMAARHPYRNLLRSALSGDVIELTDAPERPVALQKGDLILAATDGLLTLTDADIANTLAAIPPHKSAAVFADALLRAVEDCNKLRQDNTTVAVIKFTRKTLANRPGAAARKSIPATKTISKKPGKRKTSAPSAMMNASRTE